MKADHRHELKTNELADWIGHFPEWAKENRTTLIAAGAVVVVAIGVYAVKFRHQDTAFARQQLRLTSLVTKLPGQEQTNAAALAQGLDQPGAFLSIAEELEDFADTARKNEMAAMALIARGHALRADLHYRLADVTRTEVAKQIALAQLSYGDALERAASVPALAAAAQFGLGLCEEELGNFEKAREIYEQVANNASYGGTTAQAAAAQRLRTMNDYKTAVVFKPSPTPRVGASLPNVQVGPDAAAPAVVQPVPNEATPVAPTTPAQEQDAAGQTPGAQVPEVNAPAAN
jgi:hypothetical protein